jgi:L-threonine kinase
MYPVPCATEDPGRDPVDEQPRHRARIVGMGSCPLTLGECVQGRLADGRFFLITSPIGLYSRAEFVIDRTLGDVIVDPPCLTKSLTAVKRYVAEEGLPASGLLRVETPLGCGQGFGTSTGDMTASLRAVAAACGRTIPPARIAQIAIEIEPTDGSMYSGCVAFAHREGLLLEALGTLPRFEAIVALPGGIVDTAAFDEYRRDYSYGPRDQQDLLAAWQMVRHANRTGDVGLMAAAATMSTRINEQLLPKLLFREMLEFAELSGIDGLMAAHSGTALAFIFDPARAGYLDRLLAARAFVDSLNLPAWFQIGNDVRSHIPGLLVDAPARLAARHTFGRVPEVAASTVAALPQQAAAT